nr:hypothetical protein [Pedobacter xixiisoli]
MAHFGVFSLRLLSQMPLGVLYLFADLCYLLIYYVFGYRKKVVRANLLNSFSEKSIDEIITIEKKFFKYLTCLIVEVVKMDSISKSELRKRIKFKRDEHLLEMLMQ